VVTVPSQTYTVTQLKLPEPKNIKLKLTLVLTVQSHLTLQQLRLKQPHLEHWHQNFAHMYYQALCTNSQTLHCAVTYCYALCYCTALLQIYLSVQTRQANIVFRRKKGQEQGHTTSTCTKVDASIHWLHNQVKWPVLRIQSSVTQGRALSACTERMHACSSKQLAVGSYMPAS
jgi:hypothetical protein